MPGSVWTAETHDVQRHVRGFVRGNLRAELKGNYAEHRGKAVARGATQ